MTYKVTLPCTKAEAERLAGDVTVFADLDAPPVLMTSEPDESRPDEWRLDAYFENAPGDDDLALLLSLVPSAAGTAPQVEALPEEDWVTLSQAGLEPIHAGRFFVHTPAHRNAVPQGAKAFEIDAGRAFGTGQHETTAGCLLALDRMKGQGLVASNLIDLGTGTGLLAFAAMHLWPTAKAAATDIDPVAVEVAAENAVINAVPLGRARGQLELIVAAGMDHPRIAARGPYDLIIANILAGPLIELAPAIAAGLEPGGRLVLAGLLTSQADAVASAYRRHGLAMVHGIERGDWTILTMRKRRSTGWR